MSECPHIKIQTWVFEDDQESAAMWSCRDCGRKFVPLDLDMERDAKDSARLRKEIATLKAAMGSPE